MSTNKTENLNLHSWEPTDPFKRTEFNENFAAIDAAVGALQTGALHIATGSYTGTGTYGSSNKKSITFSFVPKLVLVSNGKMKSAIVSKL